MNPMTNVKNIQKLNDKVLQMGVEDNASWHKQYKDSAYVFIGGLPYDLSEGDILCVFSQYGEIVDINLVRDKSSGKSKGYGFLCYEDQRSTILAVDNLNSIKLGGRTIRVDHVADYKRPKGDERDENGERKELPLVGCAPTTPPGSDPEDEREPKKKKKKKDKSKKRAKENKTETLEEKERKKLSKRKVDQDDQNKLDGDRKKYNDSRDDWDSLNKRKRSRNEERVTKHRYDKERGIERKRYENKHRK